MTGGLYIVDSSSYTNQFQVAILPPCQSGNSQIQTLKHYSGFYQVLGLQPAGGTIILSGQTTVESYLHKSGNTTLNNATTINS
jgi:hypothetical protein